MAKVKFLSGPLAGQENLVEMAPRDLLVPAQYGWRWLVDWSTVPESQVFDWARMDMTCKIASCLIRGGKVVLQLPGEPEQKWSGHFSEQLAGEIEDAVVNSGYNVAVVEDSENALVISGSVPESSVKH